MIDMKEYVRLIESNITQVKNEINEDVCYLFSHDAEKLYESSGIGSHILKENRVQWLRDNIIHKLEPVAEEEGVKTEDLFDWIIKQDPSHNNQYSQWLMKILVGKNAQSSLDDLEKANVVLTKYTELKKSNKLNPEHKDLNRFNSVQELSNAINETEQNIQKHYDSIEQRARSESNIIHEDSEWIVVIPETEYAAGYWGKESLWCTATGFEGGRQEDRDNNMFNEYNDDNLYIIHNKKKPRQLYQLSIASDEFVNSEDEEIDNSTKSSIVKKFPALEKELLNELLEWDDVSNDVGAALRFSDIIGYIPVEIDRQDIIETNDPYTAYSYAKAVGKVDSDIEDIISKGIEASTKYAHEVLKGRFEQGEDRIALDSFSSFFYAREVLKGRFEKGEKEIAKDVWIALNYAKKIVKGRFKEGEGRISLNANASLNYAINVLNGRFEKGEDVMRDELSDKGKEMYYELTGIKL